MVLSARTAEVELNPSRALALAIVACHCLAVIGLCWSNILLGLKAALGFALLVSVAHTLHSLFLASPTHVAYLDERFFLTFRDGEVMETRLISPVVLLGWLVVMNLRSESGRVVSVVLTAGAIDPDQFRRFRVFLNLKRQGLFNQSVVE